MDFQTFTKSASDVYAALSGVSKAVEAAGMDKALTELVYLRVSQINGCAFCLQFHLNIARKLDIDPRKFDLLAGWRDAGIYTAREAAALGANGVVLMGVGSSGSPVGMSVGAGSYGRHSGGGVGIGIPTTQKRAAGVAIYVPPGAAPPPATVPPAR